MPFSRTCATWLTLIHTPRARCARAACSGNDGSREGRVPGNRRLNRHHARPAPRICVHAQPAASAWMPSPVSTSATVRIVPAIQAVSCAPPRKVRSCRPCSTAGRMRRGNVNTNVNTTTANGPPSAGHSADTSHHVAKPTIATNGTCQKTSLVVSPTRCRRSSASVSPARPVLNATSRGSSATMPTSVRAR